MSDRKALAREIAARSKPRFISIPREPKSGAVRNKDLPEDRIERARVLAARTKARFIEIPRERNGVPLTEEELTRMRGGMNAEEYRFHLIQKFAKKRKPRSRETGLE
jgi:hypothetical protein